jgi:hypothetical protein
MPILPHPDSKYCKFSVLVVWHEISSNFGIHYFPWNEDKISKSALEDNLFWFRTNCTTGFWGSYLLAP